MRDDTDIQVSPKVAVLLSGTGGQGLLLAGRILAEAAAIHDGLNVVQTNSYGPEARGGASRSEVVMSPGDVDDLRSSSFDILICLSQKACDAYYGALIENGLLIVDSTNVSVVPTSRAIEIPMTMMAVEECGTKVVTNMVALGVLCGISDLVTFEALKSAVSSTMRSDLVSMNIKALDLGYRVARNVLVHIAEKRNRQIRNYGFLRGKRSESATLQRSIKRPALEKQPVAV